MDDHVIRINFHNKWLKRHHTNSKTMVVNELGLNHGKNRADIAIINGRLIGYEIKSDVDSLRRLTEQIVSYDAIFDRSYLIVTEHHLKNAEVIIPERWGIILATEGKRGSINFKNIRKSKNNTTVDNYAVAKLLWRPEAQEILGNLGVYGKQIRENRDNLYNYIVKKMTSTKLRKTVRSYLIKRTNWKYHSQPFPDDD